MIEENTSEEKQDISILYIGLGIFTLIIGGISLSIYSYLIIAGIFFNTPTDLMQLKHYTGIGSFVFLFVMGIFMIGSIDMKSKV